MPPLAFSVLPFGRLADGTPAHLYQLSSPSGVVVTATEFGATLVGVRAPDRNGQVADIVLGYDGVEGYLSGKSHFGATVGRFANRLAGGKFSLEGHEYQLARNDGANHLHGGPGGFGRQAWEAHEATTESGPAVRFIRTSPDGEEGYPGNLRVEVTFSLDAQGALKIEYRAETDAPTILNLTNHGYFNLSGQDSANILGHEMMIAAEAFTPTNRALIPTGGLRPVADTPFDFRTPHLIGERIGMSEEQLTFAGGYDHNFVLGAPGTMKPAARVHDPHTGRTLEVSTTEPGVQFYSGNFLNGNEIGKERQAYAFRSGFCLETQHYPDSPNQPAFPSTVLRPGAVFRSATVYRFGVA